MVYTVTITDSAGTPNVVTLNCTRVDNTYLKMLTLASSPSEDDEGETWTYDSKKNDRLWILTFYLNPSNHIDIRQMVMNTMCQGANTPIKLNVAALTSMGSPHVLPENWDMEMDYNRGGGTLWIKVKLTLVQCSVWDM